MKVTYFGYYLLNADNEQKFLFDMRSFLKIFCKVDNPEFKNKFMKKDEHIYLVHLKGDIFLFLMTRNKELIKKINPADISISEFLSQKEQVSFASYLLVKEDYFGIASTVLAPKVNVFAEYIDDLFKKIGIEIWRFKARAILHQATKDEAFIFNSIIGKTSIEISKENSFFQDLLNVISVNTEDCHDLKSIEITIKPKRGKNIKEVSGKLLDKISDEGVEKMILKCKDEVSSQLLDIYLVGKGAVSNHIDKSQEDEIPALLENKATGNQILIDKLKEYRSDESFKKDTPDDIVRFNDVATWSNLSLSVSQTR